ncbi:hypothetical protein RYX36_033799 [Vicia faba]
MKGSPFAFKTWVRVKQINFSRSAINEFLGNPCTLDDDELDEYHIQLARGNWKFDHLRAKLCKREHTYEVNALGHLLKFQQKSLKAKAQVLMCVILYNIRPQSHTSSILVQTDNLVAREVPVAATLPAQSHFDLQGDYNMAMHEAH